MVGSFRDLSGHDEIAPRFLDEAQIGGQLQHPGIVPVYDMGHRDGVPYFMMKLTHGETLSVQLEKRRNVAMQRRQFVSMMMQVCQGERR